MVHRPYAYAEMLKARLLKLRARCWLVNTGWTGGSFGLRQAHQHPAHPRASERRPPANSTNVPFRTDPVFGFEVPPNCEGVPARILDPASTWPSRDEYDQKYQALAARFIENFKLMTEGCPEEIIQAGPQVSAAPLRLRQVGQTIAFCGLPTPPRRASAWGL